MTIVLHHFLRSFNYIKVRSTNFDMAGRQLYQKRSNVINGKHEEEIDLPNAPAGIYFVQIKTGEQMSVRKIIVE